MVRSLMTMGPRVMCQAGESKGLDDSSSLLFPVERLGAVVLCRLRRLRVL